MTTDDDDDANSPFILKIKCKALKREFNSASKVNKLELLPGTEYYISYYYFILYLYHFGLPKNMPVYDFKLINYSLRHKNVKNKINMV